MSTYYARKEQGLCPMCGGTRSDLGFVLCGGCRGPLKKRVEAQSNNRIPFVDKRLFLGLHEWMIQQGKHFMPEYEI